MSMSVTYDGTAFSMDDERCPDSPLNVSLSQAGAVRRNFFGTASGWQRWRKHAVDLTWTGVSSAVAGSIYPLGSWTGIVYGTGFDAVMFGAASVNFRVVPDSWSAELTGLASYTVGLTLVEV